MFDKRAVDVVQIGVDKPETELKDFLMRLTHPFLKEGKNVIQTLLTKRNGDFVDSLSSLESRIRKNADILATIPQDNDNPFYVISGSEEAANSYKGNAFEFFAEALLTHYEDDARVGIRDYKPLSKSALDETMSDIGVDGIGIGFNGKPAAVQIKLRVFDKVLNADVDHLWNFYADATSPEYGVDRNDFRNLLIITGGDKIFYKNMETHWKGKVRYIANAKSSGCMPGAKRDSQLFSLKTLLNGEGGRPFWETFRAKVKELS